MPSASARLEHHHRPEARERHGLDPTQARLRIQTRPFVARAFTASGGHEHLHVERGGSEVRLRTRHDHFQHHEGGALRRGSSGRGAVAAPTAGLHFDEAILNALRERGVQTAAITLHVGAGTFTPVRDEDYPCIKCTMSGTRYRKQRLPLLKKQNNRVEK